MNRFHRAKYALITAAALAFSGPIAKAGVGHDGPRDDPPDEWHFKFLGGTTASGTVVSGGITVSFNVTLNSCGASGNDCRRTPTGWEPR